jgi:hypothetical protein
LPPLVPCVLAAPRWLALCSDFPEFPDPSNAPAVRVGAAAGFEVGRAAVEVADPAGVAPGFDVGRAAVEVAEVEA